LTRLSVLISTYSGISVAAAGSISVARTSSSRTRLPWNWSLARAQPSIGANTRLPMVTAVATIRELRKNRGKSRFANSRL
jgi:hypothetical protein